MQIIPSLMGLLIAQSTGLILALFTSQFHTVWNSIVFGTFVANIFALITLVYIRLIHTRKPGKAFINWFLGSIPVRMILFTGVLAALILLIDLQLFYFVFSFIIFYGIFVVIEIIFVGELNKREG